MDNHRRQPAPDYTQAALTMLGVNLLWIFVAVWSLFGFAAVLLLALLLNRAITWIATRQT